MKQFVVLDFSFHMNSLAQTYFHDLLQSLWQNFNINSSITIVFLQNGANFKCGKPWFSYRCKYDFNAP